jgi:hypothetical protein
VQKSQVVNIILHCWDLGTPKAALRLLMKLSQVSITPTFYVQLLCNQIPKRKKVKPSVFFVLLGFVLVKYVSKMLVKLTQESKGQRAIQIICDILY